MCGLAQLVARQREARRLDSHIFTQPFFWWEPAH